MANEKRKKRRFFWWRLLGVLTLFIAGIVVGKQWPTDCKCATLRPNAKGLHPYIQQLHCEPKRRNRLTSSQWMDTSFSETKNIPESINFGSVNEKLTNTSLGDQENNTSASHVLSKSTQTTENNMASILPKSPESNSILQTETPQLETSTSIVERISTSSLTKRSTNHQFIEQDTTVSLLDSLTKLPLSLDKIPFISIPYPIVSVQSLSTNNESKMGALVYGGTTFYKISLFKPYFASGHLSNSPVNASGFELGLGFYRKLTSRFSLQFHTDYSSKQSGFNYNLMVGESEYFDLYQQGEPIPLENLGAPNSCNCFLVESVKLDHQISALNLKLGSAFTWINQPKSKLNSMLNISTNLLTAYKGSNIQIVDFPVSLSEQFNTIRLTMGIDISYQILRRMEIGLFPSFNMIRLNKSAFFAQSYQEFRVPLQLKFNL